MDGNDEHDPGQARRMKASPGSQHPRSAPAM